MPGALRETKLTDFFQRRPSLLLSGDSLQPSSQSSALGSLQSAPCSDSPVVAKRKPGRSKGSGKKEKHNHEQPVHVSSKQSPLPGDSSRSRVPRVLASGSSPATSGPSCKKGSKKPKVGRKKALSHNKEAYPLCLPLKADLRVDSASQHRSRMVSKSSPNESSSPRPLTRSKRRLDDNDDTASVTSSGVPLSLYYTPRQISSPSPSRAPMSPLVTDDPSSPPSSKRRRLLSRKEPHSYQAPVTPKKAQGNEIIPTSQSSEIGLYSPIHSNVLSQRRNDVQQSVENWRHGRSAYRCDIVSPLRFASDGDYSMENERPLSPLTTCPNSTGLESPLSSFIDIDLIPSDVDLDNLPAPLPQHALPTPSSSSEGKSHPPLTQVTVHPVRPVTPPPSSPEQEQSTTVPVVPKDPETRTAEIIAEIWANVRAKSLSDDEDSYLHAPLKEQLSSDEEEDDEPFWKRKVNKSRHLTLPSITGGASRNYPHSSLPSPSSPSHSQLSVSPDDSLSQPNDHDDHIRRLPDLPIADPVSPLVERRKRPVRTGRPTHVANIPTLVAIPNARKVDPIKAMLRERKREACASGGIEALNRAEGYDHDMLLSDFSIDEAEEPIDTAAPTRSSSVDANTTRVVATCLRTEDTRADITANALEDEVQQDERERLLGAKEGEAVGKILDADRKMGQTLVDKVPGVSVFIDDHEGTVDVERGTETRPRWESAKDKTTTLEMLIEALEQQDIGYMQAVFWILTSEDMAVPGVPQWLCEQALWNSHEHLGRFSLKFLLEMPLWAQSYPGSPLSVALLTETMMRLGLREDLSTHVQSLRATSFPRLQNRPRILRSIVNMVASFAPRWSMDQLPDLVIVLLLIGVDKDSTTELRKDILHPISLLCRRLPAKPGDGIEVSVVKKVLDLTRPLSPADQALLLSFFTKGSPSSLRISRAVAYHVLTGSAVSPASYALPPLGPLIDVLSDPDEQFSITDSMDYDALTSRVAVLGVALSGIENYVAEESMLRKLAHICEGSPRRKEPMPLEQIRARLDAIHGRIFDTRAAHLDRSRAKGAIQRLSMRVHYQRAALSKTGGQLRLGDFFSPGANSRQPKRRIWS